MAGESLIIGNGNWGVKSGNLLGYNLNEAKYVPRELTFTRATTGTRTNGALLVEEVPYNLILNSQGFNIAPWATDSTSSLVPNAVNAPDGTKTAFNIIPTAVSAQHYMYQMTNYISNNTVSIYAKANGYNYIALGTGVNSNVVFFNLSNGTIGTVKGSVAGYSIENVGNGWYRCSVNLTVYSGSFSYSIAIATIDNSFVFTGDGTSSVSIWGAQNVVGSLPLAYLPTTTRLNIPRIDYSTGTAALLMEPQRTNLQLNSENFSVMGQLSVTTTVNQIEAPSGLITADLITELATTATHGVFNNAACSVVSGTVYTLSCYFKKGPGATAPDIVQISSPQGFSGFYANFNITTGVVTQSFGVTSTAITSVGNGWWRCSFTATASSTAGFSGLAISLTNNNPTSGISPSYLGQTTSNIYVWGAQVEAGSFATSYIPTTSASVTRNADVSTTSGMANFIGQTEGTLFIDFIFKTPQSNLGGQVAVTSNSISIFDRVVIWNNFTTNTLAALVQTNNATVYNISLGTFVDGTQYKIAIAYKSGDSVFYVNGVQVGSSSASFSFSAPLTTFILGAYESASFGAHQRNNSSIIFMNRLSNAELAILTTK